MKTSGNGAHPSKSPEQVATEMRERLERMLGTQRAEQVWRDPAAIQEVVQDENEAAAVAEIMFRAWKDLPDEEQTPDRPQRSRFRRGLQIAMIAAVAVWSLSILRRMRGHGDDA